MPGTGRIFVDTPPGPGPCANPVTARRQLCIYWIYSGLESPEVAARFPHPTPSCAAATVNCAHELVGPLMETRRGSPVRTE